MGQRGSSSAREGYGKAKKARAQHAPPLVPCVCFGSTARSPSTSGQDAIHKAAGRLMGPHSGVLTPRVHCGTLVFMRVWWHGPGLPVTHLYGAGLFQSPLAILGGDRVQPHQREEGRDGGTRHEPAPHHHQVVRGPAGHNMERFWKRRGGTWSYTGQALRRCPLSFPRSPGEGHACRRLELSSHRE